MNPLTSAAASGVDQAHNGTRSRARRPSLAASDAILMEKVQTGYTYPLGDTGEDESDNQTVLEKLDTFLEALETRMNAFENYFKREDSPKGDPIGVKDFYETLHSVKRSILSPASRLESIISPASRLESLTKVLDDHYGSLFPHASSVNVKLLMGLNFLDAKLSQLENFMNSENHTANLVNTELTAIQSRMGAKSLTYNLDRCLHWATTRYLNYYELPLPWRENKFILNGYRFTETKRSAYKSMVCMHNETLNIWTHLVGFAIVLWIALWHFPSTAVYQQNTFVDNLVLYGFLGGASFCLVSSVFWHTFASAASLGYRNKCACVDYTGITVLITTSIITTEHAALYHYPVIRAIFMTFSLLCGAFGFVFNWTPYFDKPESRPLRIGFYVSLAALGVCAGFCLMAYKGFTHSLGFYAPLMRSIAMYLTGVVFYGCLIPERWRSDYTIFTQKQPQSQEGETEYLDELEALTCEGTTDPTLEYALSEGEVEKLFNKQLVKTPHADSLSSLWWVDLYVSSHNLWHVFVLLGILGHYVGILEMFGNIAVNA